MRIDNRTDTFSYGDVLDAIDELNGYIEICPPAMTFDEHAERASLLALLKQVSDGDSYLDSYPLFVRDSYFVQYARELADDIGVPRWPFNCIDWQKAADELQQDYYDVDFDGVTYWVGG